MRKVKTIKEVMTYAYTQRIITVCLARKKKINKNCQVEEGRRKSNRKKVKLAVPKSAGPNARRPGALKELAEIDMKFFDFLSKWLLGVALGVSGGQRKGTILSKA